MKNSKNFDLKISCNVIGRNAVLHTLLRLNKQQQIHPQFEPNSPQAKLAHSHKIPCLISFDIGTVYTSSSVDIW
jgi:hypothetical protein